MSRSQHTFWAIDSSHWSLEGKYLPGTLAPPQARGQSGKGVAEGAEPRGRDRPVGTVGRTEGRGTSDVRLPGERSRIRDVFGAKKFLLQPWDRTCGQKEVPSGL